MNTDIIAFLRARIAEDTHAAQEAKRFAREDAHADAEEDGWYVTQDDSSGDPIVAVTPRRALHICSLMTQLVDADERLIDGGFDRIPHNSAVLAETWADHEDYRPAWST